tara:strand:+ start:259 stop:606 length:348 start_codon:yes stop_codon:yes gene_type:complete
MKRFILLLLVGLFFGSCEEEATEYFVKVRVTNEDGVPIQNAAVKMSAPVTGSTEWYNFTGPSGEVVFRSGFEAYYDLKAWKMVYEGCNYVRLVKGETVDVNVVIYPIGDPNGCVE